MEKNHISKLFTVCHYVEIRKKDKEYSHQTFLFQEAASEKCIGENCIIGCTEC